MRRARSSGSPVSLFTFLDVLVGTLGALIVLLLAITRQAQISHEATFAAAEAEAVEDLPPLPDLVELPPLPALPPPPKLERAERLSKNEPLPELPPLVDPRAELAAKRDELRTRLEGLRAEESPADHQATDRLASLTKYLKDLQARLDQLVDAEKAEQEAGSGLKVELEKLREQMRNAGRGSDHVENRYAVVPYIGPNGTRRQPIYLECRKESITLRPEGIAFGPELLARPDDPDNPLATTVRALVNELKRDARGADGVPYPLLLVRPDGIAAYYLAQRALESVDLPVGYELIDEGIELDFPAPNEKTAAVARTVVSAFERQMGIASTGGSRSASRDAPYPEFGSAIGSGNADRWDAAVGNPPGAGSVPGAGGTAGVGGNRWEPPGPAGVGGSRPGAPGAADDAESLAASRGNGGSVIGAPGRMPGGLGGAIASDPGAGTGPALGKAPSVEEASRLFDAGPAGRASLTGQPGGFAGGTGSLRENEPGNGANSDESEGVPGQGPGGGPGQPRAVASLPGLRPGGSTLGQPGAGDEASEGGAAGNGGGSPRAASGPHSTDGRRPGIGGGSSAEGTAGATGGGLAMAKPGPATTAQAGLPGASASDGAGGESTGTGVAGGVAGSGAAPGAEGGQEAGAPPNGQSVGGSFSDLGADGLKVGGNDPASPLAVNMSSPTPERRSFDDMLFEQPKERGTRPSEEVDPDTFVPPGGLSRTGRGVSGLKVSRRPVRRAVMIECREDGVILYPGRGYLPLPPNAPTSVTELAARQLHQHVLKVVQGWGLPGTMHYWQPVVLFYVRPDGLANYYSMRFALMNSKLEIQHQVIDWNAILELPKWNNNLQTSSLPDRVFR